ncbi:hypothetical protein [Streptomyces sp. NPDC007063]
MSPLEELEAARQQAAEDLAAANEVYAGWRPLAAPLLDTDTDDQQ